MAVASRSCLEKLGGSVLVYNLGRENSMHRQSSFSLFQTVVLSAQK
jgi:hypothetical protein